MTLPRSGGGRGRRGRRARPPVANPQPTPRRASSVNAVSRLDRDRARSLLDESLRPRPSSEVRYQIQVSDGQELTAVDGLGKRIRVFVALGLDGRYSTESVPGRFESIYQLLHALGAYWSPPFTVGPPSQAEQHVGSSASAQYPHPGVQHLAFSGLRCKEQQVAEPASAETLHKLVSSTTAASLPSPRHTIEALPPSGRSISSSPIWDHLDFNWEMSFYIIKDLRGCFHTFPHVGGQFQSKDEAMKAIDSYLTGQVNPEMGIGLSKVEKLIQNCRYFPDGTKRRLKAGQPIDKRRDMTYQLVQAVVYKYNDHHNLFGDDAYEVKDVLDKPSLWEEENYRMYMHMNFTAKTKGSDGFDSDDLFFAEVTYVTGEDELTVNCCCMVKSFDNGPCLGCGTSLKHPNDGNAYTGGRLDASYSQPFGPTWGYDEDSDEEVERLRFLLGGAQATAGVPLEA